MGNLVTSTTNPRVKALVRLRRRRDRDAAKRFLVEGNREVRRAVAGGVAFEELVVCPALLDEERRATVDDLTSAGTAVVMVAEAPFRKVAYRRHPDGLLGVARQPELPLERLSLPPQALAMVVAGIEKPGNLGAMLRAADGAAVDAVVVADPATDLFNPNVVRASQGALLARPTAIATAEATVAWAAGRALRLVAGFPAATADYWDADLTGAVGLVVGSEHAGLEERWAEVCTPVRIPMAGIGDSLNAATAAALLLYEAVRQRRRAG
jgi:TrmH family RNA methyltransferase